jgi:alpha-1,3-mannosyltransferase
MTVSLLPLHISQFTICKSPEFCHALSFIRKIFNLSLNLFGRLAISVKMSALLYLPALLMNLNFHFGIIKTLASVALLVVMQLAIGTEFILHDSQAYFSRAFEFSRVFVFKWSVNW